MKEKMKGLKERSTELSAFMALILIALLVCGCVASDDKGPEDELPGTDETSAQDDITGIVEPITNTYSENDSQSIAHAIRDDIIIIKLRENPSTGYSWNMTYSEGLELKDDSYEQEAGTEGLVGAGGVHQWTFEVTDTGEQTISAVYMRPWEEVTGTEETFEMNIIVLPEEELIKSRATVKYIELEGGFYGIITADEARYDPINLEEQLRIDGMEVEFVAYPRNDLMSFHMWGQIVEIRTIDKISEKQ
ncbi:protease inhibitor I42 family protein [Methanolobus sp. WCC5]|uniref:protease inhibitor I42 family protein n=1 Tax=Methanolobus sp. WCC5 TaxID=3125785 RepID=UPI00324FE4BF